MPEPLTPATTHMRPTGTRKSTSCRLFARAPESSIHASAIGRFGRSTRAVSSSARAVGERGSDEDLRGRPLGDNVTAVAAAARAEIDHVVGRADRLRVVLDDEHRRAHVRQLPQVREQPTRVARVKADRRLVEHVERARQAAAELRAEPKALHLAARERGRRAVEGKVAEAHLLDERQAPNELGVRAFAIERVVARRSARS